MAGIPAPQSTDNEDISWALETATALWKRGDKDDALSWLKRAVQAARDSDLEARAVELETAASALQPPDIGLDVEIEIDTPQNSEEVAELIEVVSAPVPKKPAGPPKPPPPMRAGPPKPPPPVRPAAASTPAEPAPPPVAPAPPAPVAAPPVAAPPAARTSPAAPPTSKGSPAERFADENTMTEWPPVERFSDERTMTAWPPRDFVLDEKLKAEWGVPESAVLPSIEETVTEWPPRGAAADLLDSLPSLDAPAANAPTRITPAEAASAAPVPAAPAAAPSPATIAPSPLAPSPAASAPLPVTPTAQGSVVVSTRASQPDAPVSSVKPRSSRVAPTKLDLELDDDWPDPGGPPTYRPPEAAKPATSLNTLLQQHKPESLVPPPEPARAPLPSTGRASDPLINEPPISEVPAPTTQKMNIPSALLAASIPQAAAGLDELPAFADIPEDQRREFFDAAKRKTLQPREFVRGFALGVILRGEVQITGFNSDVSVATLGAGAVLRARGTVGKPPPLRMMARAGGCEVVTWSEAPLNKSFQSCPWVDTALRGAANPVLALVGAASGLVGSLDPGTFVRLCEWLQPRVVTGGEIALHEGEMTPPLAVVGMGSVEVVRGGVVERTLQPGELILPGDCARGVRSTASIRGSAEGAVVLTIDKARRQPMQGAFPALSALLAGL